MYIHTALPNTIGCLKTSQYQPTSTWISWAAVGEDAVTGYTVQVEGPDSTREIPIRNKYSTSVRVSDLSPSSQYTFEVKAVKSMKSTFPPPKIIIIIMHIHTVPDAPGELKISHSLPTSAQLSWTPVPEDKQNDTIIGYRVRVVKLHSLGIRREIPVMNATATSFEVSDLQPYTTYTFSVSALTEIGTGLAKSVSSTTPEGGEILNL